MEEIFTFDKWLLFTAVLSSLIFAINFICSFFLDLESDFKFLSVQGISGFFMIFSWVMLAALREFNLSLFLSLSIALFFAMASFFIMRKIFLLFHSFQHDGTVDLSNALLTEGEVYMNIPPDSIGQVQIPLQGRMMILDAISADKELLKTGEKIQVIEIYNNVLKVKRI